MTTRYNRSEIMKRAWELIRKGQSKSVALAKAWKEAKSIKAADVKAGNVIRLEYGDYNNMVECTVVSKSNGLFLGKYYIINAVAKNGTKMEFCAEPAERFEMAA